MSLSISDRVAGGIIGSAVGDAVGMPCECHDYRKLRAELGEYQGLQQLLDAPELFERIKKWQKFEELGQVTDDTVIADILLDSMLKHDGQVSAYEFAEEWEQFETPVIGPSGESIVRFKLVHFIEYIPYFRNKLDINKRELGHGEANATNAIMYIAPVGLLNAGDPLAAELMAVDITSVNQHGNPRDVAGGYAAALAACFLPDISVEEIIDIALHHTRDYAFTCECRAMVELAGRCTSCEEYIERYYTEIIGPIIPYRDQYFTMTNQDVCVSWRSSEVLGIALALFRLTRGEDARAMILAASKIGRDADTIARVAAGLVGAYRGLQCIPAEWTTLVLQHNAWLRLEEKSAHLTDIITRRLRARVDACQRILG